VAEGSSLSLKKRIFRDGMLIEMGSVVSEIGVGFNCLVVPVGCLKVIGLSTGNGVCSLIRISQCYIW